MCACTHAQPQVVKLALVGINSALISQGIYDGTTATGLNATLLTALLASTFFLVLAYYAVRARSIPLVYLVRACRRVADVTDVHPPLILLCLCVRVCPCSCG
jgi:hypothetical protein